MCLGGNETGLSLSNTKHTSGPGTISNIDCDTFIFHFLPCAKILKREIRTGPWSSVYIGQQQDGY